MNEINQDIFEKQTEKAKAEVNTILTWGLTIISYILIGVAYYSFCYISLPALSWVQSDIVLLFILITIALVEAISPYATKPMDYIFTEVFVLEIITCIRYATYFGMDMIIALSAAVFLAVLITVFVVIKKEHFARNKASNTIRLVKYLRNTLAILCIPLVIAVGMARYNSYAFCEIANPISAETKQEYSASKDKNYAEALFNWKAETPEARLNALCLVEQDLCKELGIATLPISAIILDSDIAGEYVPESNTIRLDYSWLKNCSVEDAVNCIAHETFHAYQQRLIELYRKLTDEDKALRIVLDSNASEYSYNAWNYLGADAVSYVVYKAQVLEADARAFAKDQMVNILNNARIHLSEDVVKKYE